MSFSLLPEETHHSEQPKSIGKQIGEVAKEVVRPQARVAARAIEQTVGLPGDIFSLLNRFVAGPISEKITGEKAVPYEETTLGKILPTTSTHRENIKSLTGGFLEPKNEIERFADDVITDTTALLLPIKTKVPFKRTFSRAFSTSLGANALGEGAKDLTGDEAKGSYAKMGSLFLLSLLNKPSAAKFAGDLYKEAEAAIPSNAQVNASNLVTSLNNLKNKMSKGTLAPSEKFIIDESDAILSKVKNGKISPEEAWASKRSLNEKLEKVLYDTPQKAAQARARKFAGSIQHELKNVLQDYGKTNPKFYENFKKAEEAFGTIGQSNLISKFVDKNLKYSPLTAGLLHLFHGPIGASAAATAIPYQGAKLLYRISKSPTLAKYYTNVVRSAAKEDAISFNKELQKLDEAFQKEEKKDQFTLLD